MKFITFCSSLLAAINLSQQANAVQLYSDAQVEAENNAFGDSLASEYSFA